MATGSYLPAHVVSNEDLTQFPAAARQMIADKTGIAQRRQAADDECTSDLGAKAARVCLERAGVTPDGVDVLILATSSPDRIQPATATRVQELIGATRAYAFDIGSVCSGAVFALNLADAIIRSGGARRVLVVASELYSRSLLNPRDFATRACLADGAGAVLLASEDGDSGIVGTKLHTDGSGADLIQVPAGGTMLPCERMERKQDAFVLMRGKDVEDFVTTRAKAVVEELLSSVNVDRNDVAFVVPHQANLSVLQGLAAGLGIDFSKFIVTLDRYGNTAGASALIAFDELQTSGRTRPGDLVVMVVFGGGLSWAATLIRL